MLSKNESKYIQSLGHKKQRDELGLFVAEGPKLAEEILQSNFEVQHIYATSDWTDAANHQSIVTTITAGELEKISNLHTPNQVLIIAKQKVALPPALKDHKTLLLDGIQDPGNMGTIIRIADWFGIQQIICSNDSVELYNPKVVQATMGSICRVNVTYTNLIDLLAAVPPIPVFGALLDGENVYNASHANECIIVIGNEARGIRPATISYITNPVTIPRIGGAESLNAAVATGILLSHLVGKPS
jgi:TrmH family RNA methyltransferase